MLVYLCMYVVYECVVCMYVMFACMLCYRLYLCVLRMYVCLFTYLCSVSTYVTYVHYVMNVFVCMYGLYVPYGMLCYVIYVCCVYVCGGRILCICVLCFRYVSMFVMHVCDECMYVCCVTYVRCVCI